MAVGSGVRFRADDIWDAPEDGNRYEVIDGDLFVSPPPLEPHQRASIKLSVLVGGYVFTHRIGMVYAAPIGLVLDEENGLEPDLIYVSNARLGIITERGIDGVPDLVVEILSRSTQARDRGIKMRRYARSGIPQYWIVDPRARTLEAYQLGEHGYDLVGSFGVGTIFRPLLFPGLEILIDDLWA
jgi:Uma2 family endonuclease